ncbi:MAG: hypothetical protein IIC40_03865 [Candidatus Marinimicrobia bacterium]|nr:hypothetical protein [Candidatus Neomarinimicrobiota bacterium]
MDAKKIAKSLGWLYWFPNPLFPFIWYRIGLPGMHPDLEVEKYVPSEEG